jgi:hypothetical protein
MNIKKSLFRAVFFQTLFSIFFLAGCGLYGPNDNTVESSSDSRLVGTWICQNPSVFSESAQTYIFTYDGTYSLQSWALNGIQYPTVYGIYSVDISTGSLTLIPNGQSSSTYFYSISPDENTLTINFSGTIAYYSRQL